MIKLLLDLLYSPPLAIVITPHPKIKKTVNNERKRMILGSENIKD